MSRGASKPVWKRRDASSEVWRVAWSLDGTRVAAASTDGTVSVLDASGRELWRRGLGRDVAWSADGGVLAVAAQTVVIVDALTGEPRRSLGHHWQRLLGDLMFANTRQAVAWSPNGARLASIAGEDGLELWDPAAGKLVWRCSLARACLAWAPDGRRIAAASQNDVVLVDPDGPVAHRAVPHCPFDPPGTGNEPVAFLSELGLRCAGHEAAVHGLAFSPDGKYLASTARDGTARIWDATSARELHRMHARAQHAGGPAGYFAASWAPDSRTVVFGSASGAIEVVDLATGATHLPFEGHDGPVWGLAWSPDGTRVASGGRDHCLSIWQVAPPRAAATASARLVDGALGPLYELKGSSPGAGRVAVTGERRLVAAHADGTIRALEMLSGAPLWQTRLAPGTFPIDADVSSRGLIAVAAGERTVRLFEERDGRACGTLGKCSSPIFAVAWSPDGARLATACTGEVCVWDAVRNKRLERLKLARSDGVLFDVHSLAWSRDGRRLAAAARRSVWIWDADRWARLAGWDTPGDGTERVAWSPDRLWLATASHSDEGVRVWDASSSTRKERWYLPAHAPRVESVAWSPDGTRIASCGRDRAVRLWDATAGLELGAFVAPGGIAYDLAWCPDSRWIACAYSGDVIALWDTHELARAARSS